MKILFAAETLYPPIGGADISIRTLLDKLSEKNDVTAVYFGKKFNAKFKTLPVNIKKFRGSWINAYMNYIKWKKIIKKTIDEINPDVIITQEFFTAATVEAAENRKVIAFVRNNNFSNIHGYEFSQPGKDLGFFNKMGWKFRLQYPFYKYIQKRYLKALKKCQVLSVSHFIQNELKKYNIESQVIRPFIDMKDYKTNKGKSILYVGPSKAKGMAIFIKILEKMPERNFIVVGNIPDDMKKYDNVQVMPWQSDMKRIYKKARILLVPSVFPDPCPRVVMEAGISGIPSLVSSRGGLPEEVEKIQIIENLDNADEWVKKIKMLDNNQLYNQLSKKAIKKAEEFSFEKQYKKLNSFFNKR